MQIRVDSNQRELKTHGSVEFPILLSEETLSRYEKGHFLHHWHPELELTYITEGEILYCVNGKEYLLKEHDGIFCNANVLHSGKMYKGRECKYLSITLLPKVIYGYESSRIKNKYIDEIIKNPLISAFPFQGNSVHEINIVNDLSNIYQLYKNNREMNELKLLSLFLSIWSNLYDCYKESYQELIEIPSYEKDFERLKKILTYIHQNYDKKISLEDIANYINICNSECCRFFKKHMNTTLGNYISSYRIEKSLYLLDNMNWSITEISYNVGFLSPSYYTQTFKKHIGISPNQYRNRTHKKPVL